MMRTRASLVIFVLLVAGGALAADAPVARPAVATKSEVAIGLRTITFTTAAGVIKIHLPDDLRPGDTISGTIAFTPAGTSRETRAANESALGAHRVELDNQPCFVNAPTLTLTLPAVLPSGSLVLVLRDAKGEEVARTWLAVMTKVDGGAKTFHLPEIAQTGRLIETVGSFDGDFSTTDLRVEDEGLWLVAESPRKLFARNSYAKAGMTLLILRERERTAKTDFRSVAVNLSAPKTALTTDEVTTLTVNVLGLDGITKPISLVLENASFDVVSIGGGDNQTLQIKPSEVVEGGHSFQRSVTGIKSGSWTISCSVVKAN